MSSKPCVPRSVACKLLIGLQLGPYQADQDPSSYGVSPSAPTCIRPVSTLEGRPLTSLLRDLRHVPLHVGPRGNTHPLSTE